MAFNTDNKIINQLLYYHDILKVVNQTSNHNIMKDESIKNHALKILTRLTELGLSESCDKFSIFLQKVEQFRQDQNSNLHPIIQELAKIICDLSTKLSSQRIARLPSIFCCPSKKELKLNEFSITFRFKRKFFGLVGQWAPGQGYMVKKRVFPSLSVLIDKYFSDEIYVPANLENENAKNSIPKLMIEKLFNKNITLFFEEITKNEKYIVSAYKQINEEMHEMHLIYTHRLA